MLQTMMETGGSLSNALPYGVGLEQLERLGRLRAALGEARSPEEVVRRAGTCVMEALSACAPGAVRLEYSGRTWSFGEADWEGQVQYERPLAWGGQTRGRLQVSSGAELSESQERALLDETVGQIAQALEARELELQLLQSARLVSMGQIAAGVAHELNQPLGAISNTVSDIYLRLAEGIAVSPGELEVMMADSLEVVKRMANTIDQLRVFSRRRPEAAPAPFSMNEVVRSGLKLMRAQLQELGVRTVVELAEGLPQVRGNAHHMEQVILNLLANARDAVQERTAGNGASAQEVCIRTRRDRGQVIAEVEDSGIGIAANDRDRLFQPFFTTKSADRGTGLGLSISHRIVKNHGGEIQCQSREGEGSLFRVVLPVAGAPA